MTAKPPISTHHWTYVVEVENEFRNSHGRIEYRWYSPLAVFFEAAWVASTPPRWVDPSHRIRVCLGGVEVGAYTSKEDAVGHVRRLLVQSPPTCRADFWQNSTMLLDAVYGVGGYVPWGPLS